MVGAVKCSIGEGRLPKGFVSASGAARQGVAARQKETRPLLHKGRVIL